MSGGRRRRRKRGQRTTGAKMTLRVHVFPRTGTGRAVIYRFNYKSKRERERGGGRVRPKQYFNLRCWISIKETPALITNQMEKSKSRPYFFFFFQASPRCSLIVLFTLSWLVICNVPLVNAIEQNDKTGLVENTRVASHTCGEINAQRADLFEFTFKYYRHRCEHPFR